MSILETITLDFVASKNNQEFQLPCFLMLSLHHAILQHSFLAIF